MSFSFQFAAASRVQRHALWRELAVLFLFLLPILCQAQSDTIDATQDMAANTDHAGELSGKHDSKTNYVVLPIPQSNPALGSGVTLVGLALYNPNQSHQPWVTGIGLMKAGDSHAGGLVQQANLMNSRLRLLAAVVRANLDLKFYGIGAAAGERGASIPLEQSASGGLIQALYQVGEHWFVGLRYQNMHVNSTIDLSRVPALGTVIPEVELHQRTVSLGPALEYDSRDDSFYPTDGISAKANLNVFSTDLGSDVNFRQFSASWNRYWAMGADKVLAARVAGCVVSGDVPFSDLCMYGRNKDLRGYATGQYRDRALLAAQAEMRWRFAQRWGGVAFAGLGAIGPSASELLEQKILPSIGAGLRWQASKDYKINVSVDVAFTPGDHAVYLYVGEAF
jgi:hypothetical protein